MRLCRLSEIDCVTTASMMWARGIEPGEGRARKSFPTESFVGGCNAQSLGVLLANWLPLLTGDDVALSVVSTCDMTSSHNISKRREFPNARAVEPG